jgi:hypothetical protein
MWALRKNEKDLSKEDRALLKRLFQHSPILETAYRLQNNLTHEPLAKFPALSFR